MSTKTRHALILITLIAVLLGLVFYAFNDPEDSAPSPQAQQQITQEQSGTPPAEPTAETSAAVELTGVEVHSKSARRIRAIPDTRNATHEQDVIEAKKEINWESEFEAQNALESALGGDVDDAIAVSELTEYCRAGFDNEQQIQSGLRQTAKMVELGQPIPGILSQSTGETLQFRSFPEYENFILTRFAQCQSTKGMFNKNLRERLAQLADAGNVNARYLFAMWNPLPEGTGSDDLISWMSYQSLAMDYTWRNISEGEPLGMLAYGRSLEQAGHVYFTPVHKRYGPAFILAAYKCGLDNRSINQKITTMTGFWKQRDMNQAISQAEELSDQIVRSFCRG